MVDEKLVQKFLCLLSKGAKTKIHQLGDCGYVLIEFNEDIHGMIRHAGISYIVQSSGTTGEPKVIFVPGSCVLPNVLDLRYINTKQFGRLHGKFF